MAHTKDTLVLTPIVMGKMEIIGTISIEELGRLVRAILFWKSGKDKEEVKKELTDDMSISVFDEVVEYQEMQAKKWKRTTSKKKVSE